ncbi:iron complex transport system permease protein [Ketogulonicigenium robustum]|uniref:Iron complex transport system permease protein n=1 Tax=Ketogulonicigenium robustum TaxID=92947 RepID=A0A1W6P0B1_9RHOB|nr:iron chelate uptake ABC transporter family permease subunit [Ketogulonicigenium robustum]ARO14884.1 iron complex transport system permease protein [Ketogulonicigenium robustum]
MARPLILITGTTLFGVVLFAWSLIAFSTFPLSITQALPLIGWGQSSTMTQIIAQIRVPRALCAVLIGAMMGLCGALMQGITRNRLASPALMGVTGGASLGLALVSSGVIALPIAPSIAAATGGAVAWALVMTLGASWSIDAARVRLILAGMTMAALCTGLTRLVVLLAEERALGVLNWLAGSLANTGYADVHLLGVTALMGIVLTAFVAARLNIVALGDEAARALGVALVPLRLAIFAGGCVMVGVTVTVTGPIAFIGLIAPNVARLMVGADYRFVTPLSAILGANLLLASDIAARWVAFPSETPAGAITALIGAPFFLFLARRPL